MKRDKKQVDIEERRVRKYIAIVIIYTLIMLAIVVVGFMLPSKDNDSKSKLPQKSSVSMNFSSTDFI